MSLAQYLLFCVILLLAAGAVMAVSYFIIKPFETRRAIVKARRNTAGGKAPRGKLIYVAIVAQTDRRENTRVDSRKN